MLVNVLILKRNSVNPIYYNELKGELNFSTLYKKTSVYFHSHQIQLIDTTHEKKLCTTIPLTNA